MASRLISRKHLWFTYGPSTDTETTLADILLAGANGCRLTFSFGTCALQERRAHSVKEIAEKFSHTCLIVADLAGEKIRLADFSSHQELIESGEVVVLCPPDKVADISRRRFPVTARRLFQDARIGDTVIVGDGSLCLLVTATESEVIQTVALGTGTISPNRGIVVQSSNFEPACLTPKDIADLEYIAKSQIFDMVALSFVGDVGSISTARRILHDANRDIPIVAKIETVQGLRNLTSIVQEADMVMAARGDLALALDWVDLPSAVQQIAQTAQDHGKPWLLATQVAEGMERFAFPTRAEICDLAHWLAENSAGVMLSYETAFGPRPVEVTSAVARMIDRWSC